MRRKIDAIIDAWDRSDGKRALLITGSRQVGKTFSIREFCQRRYPGRFLEINFKNTPQACASFEGGSEVDNIITRLSARYMDFKFEPGKTLLFLDEIQDCPAARTALKPLAEDGRYKVIASGSLIGIRMKEVGLHPMGYLKRVTMHPMDFEEFLWALGMPQRAIDEVTGSISKTEPIDGSLFSTFSEMYSLYLAVGGMPDAVKSFAASRLISEARAVHKELIDGYLDDIASYATGTAKSLTGACLDSVPRMLASENKRFMFSKVEDPHRPLAEGTKSTGFRYFAQALEWLEMANITMTCNCLTEPVSPLEERLQTDRFKLYMVDTGVLTSMYDDTVMTAVVEGHADANMGAVAENAIAQALRTQGRRLMYLSKDDPRMEVDFVTIVNGRVCCVEVKSGEKRSCRSLNRVIREYGTDGIMFETRNVFTDEKGVRHYPLFAASFMDAIDPRPETEVDLSSLDEIRRRYSE